MVVATYIHICMYVDTFAAAIVTSIWSFLKLTTYVRGNIETAVDNM